MEAADTFRRLIAVRPDDAHAHALLGAVLLKAGSVQEAEVHFGKARRLKAGDWMVNDLIAGARADSGDWEAAIRERREAVRQKPFFAIAHNALGLTLQGAGRADEAAQAFREALRRDPGFPPARFGLARALIARGEFIAAQQALGRGEHGLPPLDHNLDPAAARGKAERMIVLEARLPGLLRGESRPADAREAAEFAQLCFFNRDHDEIASLAEDERRVIRNLWSLVDSLLEQARSSIAQASPPRPS